MTNSTTRDRKLLIRISVFVFWVIVWHIISIFVGAELLVPSPLLVAKRFLELCTDINFWHSAFLSLIRIFFGALLGILFGTIVAVLTFKVKAADYLLTPIVKIIRATPVASFIILVLVMIRTNNIPTFIAMLMVLPVIWGNVLSGIRETDGRLLEMAKVFGFTGGKIIKKIYIPSVKPYFISSCGTAIGFAWKAGIAAEVLCLPKNSIGVSLYNSKIYLDTPALFAWTIVVILLSFLIEGLFSALIKERRRKGGTP